MKITLLYPEFPDSFWSLTGTVKSLSRKATCPPLGLLTVAAMLPPDWELKLIDTNVSSLTDEDIESADWVFVSAMIIQKESVARLVDKCKKLNTGIVAGGPLFTIYYDEYDDIDCVVLGEAEAIISSLIADLEAGSVRHIYKSEEFLPLSNTPVPSWSLIDPNDYLTLAIQCSRGCPFNCEFCDISVLSGDRQRIKPADNVTSELEAIYNTGWRGSVFVVDDNFIGNKGHVKNELLPAIKEWSNRKNFCFWYNTQTSINLADDEELMNKMYDVGFCQVFVGIESVDEDSLIECGKTINLNRDLLSSIRTLQNHGLEVQCGFIVGFDSDSPSVFQNQIDFMSRFASNNLTAYAGFMSFLDLFLSPSREIVLVNDREKKFLHFLNKSFLHDTNYLYPSPLLPWTEAYQKGAKEPTVFICENFSCKKPLHSIKELQDALLKRK